jgi:glycosyltransferase involved in cell wall biosynthesis
MTLTQDVCDRDRSLGTNFALHRTMSRPAESISVLMIVDEFPPSICGIGDYTANLARALVSKGVTVNVLTKAIAGLPERETVDDVNVHRLAHGWTAKDARTILRVAGALEPGAIVHVQYPSLTNYHRRVMINLLPPMFRTMRRGNPLVVTMHGFHEHRLRWRLRVLPMLWANSAVVFVHPRDQQLATRWSPLAARRWKLIPIASNMPTLQPDATRREQVRAELGLNANEPVVSFFGEVRPDKGLPTLLNAVGSLHRGGVPCKALIISTIGTHTHGLNAYEREILARLETGSREGWAMLVRAETSRRVAEVLQASDVAAFPFTLGAAENRGSLMAAVANGVPVLTTRGSSTPTGYESTYGVETVDANDQAAFAARLEALLGSPEQRANLAAKACSAAARFSWSSIADQSIEVYRKCLTG